MRINKNFLAVLFVCFGLSFFKAQFYSYGIRASMLYNFDGKLKEIRNGIENILKSKGSAKSGWQIGGFVRVKIPFLFIQPELVYSNFSCAYFLSQEARSFNSRVYRLDFVSLVGTSFLGFFRIYGAPIFSLNLNNGLDLKDSTDFKIDRWGSGFQLGLGADVSILTVDLRWEKGLSKFGNNFRFGDKNYEIENKPSMLIFSLGLRF